MVTSHPVCYVANITPTVKVLFEVEPASVTSIYLGALVTNPDPVLAHLDILEVKFYNGVSIGDAEGYVTFTFDDATPSKMRKSVDTWQWYGMGSGSTINLVPYFMERTTHTNYVIFAESLTPWINTFGNQRNAWVSALDFLFDKAGLDGAPDPNEALVKITKYLHSDAPEGHGMKYDSVGGGANHYAGNNLGGVMDLTAYMDKISIKTNLHTGVLLPSGIVNCYDQAAAVCSFGALIGIDLKYGYMNPFGYIKNVNLIGVGNCNNPFYPFLAPPNNTNLLTDTSMPVGVTDKVVPERTSFGNHAFAIFNGNVFDACAGPVLGKTKTQYIAETIDTSTHDEQYPPEWGGTIRAGDSTKITEHNLTGVK